MIKLRFHIKRVVSVLIIAGILVSMPSCKYLKQKFGLGEYSLKAAIEWAKADSTRVADSLQRIKADKDDIKTNLPDSVKRYCQKKGF
ncbi:MAG: hypothetical protein IPJ37_00670 [Bacteroidales bacterium]|nr:hypothetical protein [Bacteroidales bacterium]